MHTKELFLDRFLCDCESIFGFCMHFIFTIVTNNFTRWKGVASGMSKKPYI